MFRNYREIIRIGAQISTSTVFRRLQSHCGWESEADPGSDLDADPALLHLHASLGGGGRRGNESGSAVQVNGKNANVKY